MKQIILLRIILIFFYLAAITGCINNTNGGDSMRNINDGINYLVNVQADTESNIEGTPTIFDSGLLVTEQVPVINTAESATPKGSLLVTNVGSKSAQLSTSSASSGISNLSGCTSGTTLGVDESCTITFNVTQSGGSGTIKLNYKKDSKSHSTTRVIQAITWYNSLNGALLDMEYTVPALMVESVTTIIPVTITNAGGYNLTGVSVPEPQSLSNESVTLTISFPDSNSCHDATLNVGQSCSYDLHITPNAAATNQQILFGINGSYNNGTSQTYTRYAVLTYSTPQVIITTSPASSIDITQGGSFTITATYDNADTTVSFANANSSDDSYITYAPASCSVTSTSTSCTTTVNLASNTPIASYTTNITTNNETTPLPNSITFSAISIFSNPVAIAINSAGTYAFVTDVYNGSYSVTTCSISGGALTNCSNNAEVTGLSNPTGIAISDDDTHAFIVNNGSTSISSCTISNSGVLSNCTDSGASSLTSPYGIAVSGSYAYISTANASSTSTSCAISSDYTLTSCSHQSSTMTGLAQSGITVYSGRAYIVFGNLQGYFNALACSISGTSMSGCSYPNLGYSYNNYGIAITSNRAFITAASNHIISCNVSGGSFSSCNAQSSYGLSTPYGIAITPDGSYAFIVNGGSDSVSSCTITSGTLGNCATTNN
ncbi:MAG: hypothetical protein KBD37_08160 [Burkholderiales bacterium]|nr:hypothetical protein [Burkholderiales bacterium]